VKETILDLLEEIQTVLIILKAFGLIEPSWAVVFTPLYLAILILTVTLVFSKEPKPQEYKRPRGE